MKILIACEESGAVREAFMRLGHESWSCDLLPSRIIGQHLIMDAVEALKWDAWDMVIAFPPCTDLCVSGARWFPAKRANGSQQLAIAFFKKFIACAPKWAIENPIGIMSTEYRKPDQIIQPWQFGHGETKATCLWLGNLPKLRPTKIVSGRAHRIHEMAPGPDRAKERSKTYQGIADAMAEQWGKYLK